MSPLFEYCLRLGDNALVLGHRNSEWCGKAPILEEDIALANVALDLIGQTRLWLELAGEIEGKGRSADDLAYLRDARDFKNCLLVEQPNGDFGQTVMRQYLFDAWHFHLLGGLMQSADERVRAVAEKAHREVSYHLSRSRDLVVRLGDGTEESHGRMQRALEFLWPYCADFLRGDAVDVAMAARGVAPATDAIGALWQAEVSTTLANATLDMPETDHAITGGKVGVHSEHMGYLLAEMQFLQRSYPGAEW